MSSPKPGSGPLAGIRVLDLSRFIAGPVAGQLLGLLGADVIKIEEPAGDPMRRISKYALNGMSAHYASGNASKRGITLDLKHVEGRRIFLDLVSCSDVVVENFRPGAMERLKLGRKDLQASNPGIIIASLSGFGQTGPWKGRPAYDLIAQAAGGGMSLTGRPGEAPVKMGIPIGDLGASVFCALAIVAALYRRKSTGEGDAIDVAMFDVQLSLLNYLAHYYWASGESPVAEGDAHANVVPYQSFETLSGRMVVAVYGDQFWPGFCAAIASPDLLVDSRFATNDLRGKNRAALISKLEQHLKTQPRDHWLERLASQGVPAAPLNAVGEALECAQAVAREMVVPVRIGANETMNLLGNPMKFASAELRPRAPPELGQHTDEVLSDLLELTDAEIAGLREAGVV